MKTVALKTICISIGFFNIVSCTQYKKIQLPGRKTGALTGTNFYKSISTAQWKQRDSLALNEILKGNMPPILHKFYKIKVSIIDSLSGKKVKASYFVMPDYISIGSKKDYARIPLTPMAAQRVADSFQCFLPTKKMVDDIYRAAKIKLDPMPMYAYRDSTITMWQHNLIIEGQRKGKQGLIAGIKKDVIITKRLNETAKPHRVAIYGWHRLHGNPIQPLYTGHVDWYVDYSHGIRLVYRKIRVGKKWIDYTTVLNHPVWSRLLCDEADCKFYRY